MIIITISIYMYLYTSEPWMHNSDPWKYAIIKCICYSAVPCAEHLEIQMLRSDLSVAFRNLNATLRSEPSIWISKCSSVPCNRGQLKPGVGIHLNTRAPADREVSIKDSGFTRTGLGVTVLCLHTATWLGRSPCLAFTVWAGSRERFLVLFGNGLTGTGSGACWAETV